MKPATREAALMRRQAAISFTGLFAGTASAQKAVLALLAGKKADELRMFGCRDALLHYRSQTRKIAGPQYHWIEPQAREDSGLQKTALIRSNLAIFAVDQFAPDELLPPGSHRQILPPYRNGREVEIENGLPLGIIAECECIETSLILEPGERLTFVSDGVVEAANEKSELYGFDRTREISEQPAREIADAAKAWGQNDDITVVRRCEKIKSRRRNGLRHQCKSSVPKVGQAVSPARDGLRTFFSHLLTVRRNA